MDFLQKHLRAKSLELNPLNANPTKWPKTLKQFVGKLPTSCLSVFGHFVNLALKGLNHSHKEFYIRCLTEFSIHFFLKNRLQGNRISLIHCSIQVASAEISWLFCSLDNFVLEWWRCCSIFLFLQRMLYLYFLHEKIPNISFCPLRMIHKKLRNTEQGKLHI